jgi:diguanylate cyclase (GGDEF)-like protein
MSQGPQLAVTEETSPPPLRASRWRAPARRRDRRRDAASAPGGRIRVNRRDVPENEYVGGWLCPTKVDLVRLVDMSPAVRRARILAGAFCGLGVLVMVPWLGWRPLAIFGLAPVPLLGLDRLLRRSERPERLIAGSLCLHATLILVGAAVSGGLHSPLLPWVAIPVLTAAARFRLPVFLVGAVLATLGLVVVAVLGSPHALEHDPAPLLGVIVVLGALVVAQQPVLNAELRWRRDAVLDPLTGLLNRQGLQGRFREVAEQARLTNAPVSLVMCDLDGFKGLNDEYGHACGDAVLKDVAYVLRKELRSFELLYRVGGEELLLVLPGAGLRPGCEVAEHVRATIERSQPAGLQVTTSVGVCSALGDEIEFGPMFEAADRALYEAKHSGRNCVAYVPTVSSERALLAAQVAPLGA